MLPSLHAHRPTLIALAAAALLAACGGSNDPQVVSPGGQNPVSPPPTTTPTPTPAVRVACAWNRDVPLAYEERRLTTPLPFSGANVVTNDQTPLAQRIVQDTGFDTFDPAFAAELCAADGQTAVASYDAALATVRSRGQALWRAAVDRVQGRRASPAGSVLPASDDRMLYWTRVGMTKTLRQWAPSFTLTAAQATELQLQFERASRGQYDIDLPAGNAPDGSKYRRMIISGFDVFTLGIPGTANTGLRNGNPSGATALEMDGREIKLPDGSTMRVEAYVLPVSYDPFNLGMQEDTLGPWFQPGPKRVDASVTISQGGANQFWLEEYNGRFHGPTAGNDGIIYCPVGNRLPGYILPLGTVTAPDTNPISIPGSGCDTNPPKRWLGYDSAAAWIKDFPPQFSKASLPIAGMITADTRKGIARPPGAVSAGTEGFNVTWHTNYGYFPDCNAPATVSVPSNEVMNSLPDISLVSEPNPAWCASSGGGGSYLSNESAYRNTVLRDVFRLNIPAGHIHVPVMNNYFGGTAATAGGVRNDNAITDARYEAYRTAIVGQTKALLVEVGNSLIYR